MSHWRENLMQRLVLILALAAAGFPAAANNPDIAAAAQAQVGVTLHYDPTYRKLAYPGGDVPVERGVCTDVVVRALRQARAMDLQRLVHEEMRANWTAYPSQRIWGLKKPDSNIDHRRVPILMTFFRRAGYGRTPTVNAVDYQPGDIVAWDLGRGVLHIGVIGSQRGADGTPLVVHNIGAGTRVEDILFRFAIIGHYRLPRDYRGPRQL
jgi:uncharacterized protein YijF (DUF1287 family)